MSNEVNPTAYELISREGWDAHLKLSNLTTELTQETGLNPEQARSELLRAFKVYRYQNTKPVSEVERVRMALIARANGRNRPR